MLHWSKMKFSSIIVIALLAVTFFPLGDFSITQASSVDALFDFEDGTSMGWNRGWGDAFSGDTPVTVSSDLSSSGNLYALRVDTAYSGSGWQEAVLTLDTAAAMGEYESVSFDTIVPASFGGTFTIGTAMNGDWQDLSYSDHNIPSSAATTINGKSYVVIQEMAIIPKGSTQRQLIIKLAKNGELTYNGPIYLDNVRLKTRAETDAPPGDSSAVYIAKAQDAAIQGYGVEKRGATPEGSDTLYDGEGYISFFYNPDESQPEGTATFMLNVPEGGLYNLSLGYYIPTGYGSKNASLQVNGAGAGEVTLDAPAQGTVRAEKLVSKVLLNAGNNEVTVLRDWGYYGIEYVKVSSAVPPASGSKLEAENGIMTGSVSIGASGTGFSGDGYASFQSDGSLTLTYNAATAGLYDVAIAYSAPLGDNKTSLVINGATSEISLPATNEFVEISGGKVMLQAGANTIEIQPDWGWYYIDYVKLSAAAAPDVHAVTDTLSNPNATTQTRALMNYLVSQYGHKTISGQQELSNVDWIYQQTGKYPAIFSTDLIDYSPSRVEHGATSTEVEKMIDWYNRGGIAALCWHWNAPKGLYDEPGKEWWRGFYTDSTTFDIKYALDHPDSEDYQLLIRDIDAIAVQLKRLQSAGVPVLWRPLHEAEGGWFWWGAKGPEPAKQLWRLMYDRLTNYHGLNNLIWVWNSENPDWYPGDDVVDIVSTDIYNPAGDYNPNIAKYDSLVTLVKDKKMVALAENGPIPDPDLLQAYGADWSFFNTWTGNFIQDGVVNTAAHLNKVYNHDNVITCDELPADLYTSLRYEAEDGGLTGLTVDSEQKGYTGKGYVTGFDAAGDSLRITADVAAGNYMITIRYRTLGGDKTNNLSINGDLVSEQVFADSAEWTNTVVGPYKLQKGINTIDITNNWGWVEIDSVKLQRVPPTATVTYSETNPTNHDVVATITPNEEVTITNNGGSDSYTFSENGSFTFEFVDEDGLTGSVTAGVANIDKVAPTLAIQASEPILSVPNHKLETIKLSWNAADIGSGVKSVKLVSVISNEPDNGLGDGDTANDIQGADIGTADSSIQIRAERSGNGNGRVYKITYEVSDFAGNVSRASTTVTVST